MATTTLERPTKPAYLDRAPHDPKTDVKLAGDWLDRWLMELDEAELRAYLQLAHFYNTRTYHDKQGLSRILGRTNPERVVARLERRGLVEVVKKEGTYHYHFPYRDSDGFHRGSPARPSLQKALAFQERMSEELLELCEQDEDVALRKRLFERYPELEEEYELYQRAADPSAPKWRLWMEVSNLLIREFEARYGSLRQDHGALFKEVSAKVLNHHLELVDAVVGQILERLDKLFPEVHEEWVIMPQQEEFVSLPAVRRQAQRYGIGPEQIFLNVIEALGSQGRVVVSVDDGGFFRSMILPSDTGLTKSEERVLFLRPEERKQSDSERNRERVRRTRNKYANYMIERAGAALADFVNGGRVRSVDGALEMIVALVNDALDLLPVDNTGRLVKLEHVIDRFDAIRQGVRVFPFLQHAPLDLDEPKARAKRSSRNTSGTKTAKSKAAKTKKAAKKKKKKKKKKAAKTKATKTKVAKKKNASRTKVARTKVARTKVAKTKTAPKTKVAKKKTASKTKAKTKKKTKKKKEASRRTRR